MKVVNEATQWTQQIYAHTSKYAKIQLRITKFQMVMSTLEQTVFIYDIREYILEFSKVH